MRRHSVPFLVLLALVAAASMSCTTGGDTRPTPTGGGRPTSTDGTPEPSTTVAPIPGTWDETGFTTTGYLSPVGVAQDMSMDPALVPLRDGSLVLLYVGRDHRVRWEHYRADGSLIRTPRLEVGVLPRPAGETRSVPDLDATALEDGVALVEDVTQLGPAIYAYDAGMGMIDGPMWLGEHQTMPALAAGPETLWVAGQGAPEYGTQPPDQSIVITEVGVGPPLSFLRQWTATAPPPSQARPGKYLHDQNPDIAFDPATGLLAIVYERFGWEQSESGQVRIAIVDPDTREVLHDELVTSDWFTNSYYRTNAPGAAITASDGTATVFWKKTQQDGRGHYRVATVDLVTGTVTQTQDVIPSTAWTPHDPHMDWYEPELVAMDGSSGSHIDILGVQEAYPMGGPNRAPRFALFPLDQLPAGTADLLLDGGFPIYADLVLQLDAFAQNPRKCVVARPCWLEGAAWNRGTRSASGVLVDVTVDGVTVGTISLGSVPAGKTVPFVTQWASAPDLTAEQVTVRYAIRTTSTQFTTDNDAADFTVEVRQKGVVFGQVIDVSGDPSMQSDVYPGIAGAIVDLGTGTTVTTAEDGFFAFEDLEFGTFALSMQRDGYKPATASVSVGAMSPFAYVPIYTDNHGVLRVQVVDEQGNSLSGVDVTLLEAGRTDRTTGTEPLVYDLSSGPHTFAIAKRGYQAEAQQTFSVTLDQDVTQTVTLEKATTGTVSGTVFDRHGRPVPGATVILKEYGKQAPAATVTTNARGEFGPIELAAPKPTNYSLEASGPGGTDGGGFDLWGGDQLSYALYLTSGPGSIRGVAATEGFTSWMVKASWPGIGWVAGTDMFVWYGNYGIRVGAEYWTDTGELHAVDVTVQGLAYESHATKSEVDFDGINEDYADVYKTLNLESTERVSGWMNVVRTLASAGEGGLLPDVITVVEGAVDLYDAMCGDDAVVTGQGPHVLTWKESKEDFALIPEPDTTSFGSSVRSIWDVATSIPTSFALPVVIGGSSPERTMVRVDEIDVVSVGDPHSVLWSSNPTPGNLYSADTFMSNGDVGAGGLNMNGRRYLVGEGIDKDTAVVLVYLTIQRISQTGDIGGTAFDQREQQVVEFRVSSRAMGARIAPGDLYLHP